MLRRVKDRTSEQIRRSAAGSSPPAGSEAAPAERSRPGARERGAMRRRLREARSEREALVLELGELSLAAAHGRPDAARTEVVAAALGSLGDEILALAQALDSEARLEQVVSTDVVGPCRRCSALVPRHAAYCQRCGEATGRKPRSVPAPPLESAAEPPREQQPQPPATAATSAAPAPRSGR